MKPIYCNVPQIGQEEKEAMLQVFADEEILVQGEQVYKFEEEFAEYIGTRYAVAVNSGTDALYLSLKSLELENTFIATTPISFKATSEIIMLSELKPSYHDIDNHTGNLYKIPNYYRYQCIILVHLYGHPSDFSLFTEHIEQNNTVIIEDACQAHGAIYNGKKVGSIGIVGCFSFYPTKNMTTGGNGGMITTNNEYIRDTCEAFREHGKPNNPYTIGINSRMNTINAAIGRIQLKKLDGFNKRRKEIANIYDNELKETSIDLPPDTEGRVYHLYTIKHQKRDLIYRRLRSKNIYCGIYYDKPLHKYSCLSLDIHQELPFAEQFCKTCLSLPCHPGLTDKEILSICDIIKTIKEANK